MVWTENPLPLFPALTSSTTVAALMRSRTSVYNSSYLPGPVIAQLRSRFDPHRPGASAHRFDELLSFFLFLGSRT